MSSPLSEQLVQCAMRRIGSAPNLTEADLRPATRDLYYALFHRLCEALVEGLKQSDPVTPVERVAWQRLYRLPSHAYVVKQCKSDFVAKMPQGIRTFATQVAAFKTKRDDADYDPIATFELAAVRKDLDIAESAVQRFDACEPSSRRHFAIFAALKEQR